MEPVPPLVIAHRGDSAHRPENTLASFASALELGAEIVELDVQLTRDGQMVVIHDPTLERTTSGRGRVLDLTVAEVRAVSAGYPELFGDRYAGERVPTLVEALAFLRGRARVLIELKSESITGDLEGGLEAHAIAEVRKAGMVDEVALLSIDTAALGRCRELAPEITRGHLFYRSNPAEVVAGARLAGCDLVMPEKGVLDEAMSREAQAAGLKLGTWVVDDPEELFALERFDLFGVASNRPGVLLEALAERTSPA
jgi:glycerophosphoryl diester phosphodiesterase